jgi:para-aminobenzoate synthetase / 4-amino-4-deoxychorismate lyase
MPGTAPQIEFTPPPTADPALGVFETVLVADGRAVALRRHLERLRAGVQDLYGFALPSELEAQVEEAAAHHALGRLRIRARPRVGAALQLDLEAAQLDPVFVLPPAEVALVTVGVRAGFGPHKLIDRGWLERIEAAAGEGVRPLLVTRAGALLETTRANVFLMRDGALATPPLDGTILPGVTRELVLERAGALGIGVREVPLTLDDLRAADMVLLSGALRLLERARVRRNRASEQAAERLAAALDDRRRGDGDRESRRVSNHATTK